MLSIFTFLMVLRKPRCRRNSEEGNEEDSFPGSRTLLAHAVPQGIIKREVKASKVMVSYEDGRAGSSDEFENGL